MSDYIYSLKVFFFKDFRFILCFYPKLKNGSIKKKYIILNIENTNLLQIYIYKSFKGL